MKKLLFLGITFLVFISSYIFLSSYKCDDKSFKDEKQFENYLNNLKLNGLNINEAILHLNAEGFVCTADKNNSYCHRDRPAGCVCGQNQLVKLTRAENNFLEIKPYLQLRCL